MTMTTMMAAVAALVGAIGFWKQIVAGIYSISNFLIGRIYIDPLGANAIFYYLKNNARQVNWRTKSIQSYKGYSTKSNTEELISFETLNYNTSLFFIGWRPILVSRGLFYALPNHMWELGIAVSLPRIFWNPDEFVQKAFLGFNFAQNRSCRFTIHKIIGTNKLAAAQKTEQQEKGYERIALGKVLEEARYGKQILLYHNIEEVLIDSSQASTELSFQDEVLEEFVKAEYWLKSRKWYAKHNIPWRRGICLYSPPGGGKTLIVKKLAQKLDVPIYSFDLASLSNEEFHSGWARMMAETPCICLIEDIDVIFSGRENITKTASPLSFDTILNCISGVQSADGIYLVITTNHLDKIDPAIVALDEHGFISRPGRIDSLIKIGPMTEQCRKNFATSVLKDNFSDSEIEDIVLSGHNMMAAQFSALVTEKALKRYWNS